MEIKLQSYKRRAPFACALYLLVIAFSLPVSAQQQQAAAYQPDQTNLEARRWFQDAKFGLFIHWGVYSVLGEGEWVMHNRHFSADEYEKLAAQQFNPTAFDPAQWVSMAKAAGMKYITVTTKHHDGFAMFDSKVTDWDVVDRTPYNKDVLKMLADECHKQGIKLFVYYSHLDLHHPSYDPWLRSDGTRRWNSKEWYDYLDYMDVQLTELLTNYGEIGGVWFDGWWHAPESDWQLERNYKLIHDLQPHALIGNNHRQKPFAGEDFQIFEKNFTSKDTSDLDGEAPPDEFPLEKCETMNNTWGYNSTDLYFKSARDLVHDLVSSAGASINFLLNVGPLPDGSIQPEFVLRLREVGQWMEKNGESIHGTRGGPLRPRPWGVTTQKGNKVYVHVLDWQDEELLLPKLPRPVVAARYLEGGERVGFDEGTYGVILRLAQRTGNEYDTVVELELDERPHRSSEETGQ